MASRGFISCGGAKKQNRIDNLNKQKINKKAVKYFE